ncbi:predicted protein [Plenodomus lingam JN3]|uniref:Predicted protein n=1 Tax=Leptosphaeria maculans (strain JN3 / isolate v23.1.3 / race Av1-4-5-6-7-8) TaxID=985895 RepID=E4ZMQ6_LEPMJ|nr:predicted protein [Plenodomus lingam JN3]CBX92509.1 predicted protein [Plenodomus lingam JN3]
MTRPGKPVGRGGGLHLGAALDCIGLHWYLGTGVCADFLSSHLAEPVLSGCEM